MSGALKLEVPISQDGVTASGNVKVTIAANVFGSGLNPVISEEGKLKNNDSRIRFTNVDRKIPGSHPWEHNIVRAQCYC